VQPSEEQVIKLMAAVACEACGASYEPQYVEVLGRRDTVWFLRVRCVTCNSRGLVAARVQPAQSGPNGDLAVASPSGAPETAEPTNRDPVNRSDVRGMHRFLQTFDGDFKRHFAA
jgi:ribosomal protein S27E